MTTEKYHRSFQSLLFVMLFINVLSYHSYAKKIFIGNGKQKVQLTEGSYIGLTTIRDTVKYRDRKSLSFVVYKLNSDNIILRRPVKYVDTAIQYYNGVYQTLPFEFQVGKFFKTNKIQYVQILKLTEFETRTYLLSEITSVTYPARKSNGDGCTGCLLIPGINVLYIISSTKKQKPRKWK